MWLEFPWIGFNDKIYNMRVIDSKLGTTTYTFQWNITLSIVEAKQVDLYPTFQ